MNKKRFFLLIIIFSAVALAAYIASRTQQETVLTPSSPASSTSGTINAWNGLIPGISTDTDMKTGLGESSGIVQTVRGAIYSYPSTNQYWKNEVTVSEKVVVFIRERIFPPSNTSLKDFRNKFSEPPIVLYGPDHMSGTYLYSYTTKGVALLANEYQNTIYQVWRFSPVSINEFLALPQLDGYATSPIGKPEGI